MDSCVSLFFVPGLCFGGRNKPRGWLEPPLASCPELMRFLNSSYETPSLDYDNPEQPKTNLIHLLESVLVQNRERKERPSGPDAVKFQATETCI